MDPAQREAVDAANAARATLLITNREAFMEALTDADNLLGQAEIAIAEALSAVHDLRSIVQLPV